MNSEEIRQRFLTFFEKRGHAIIPSSSLVPENDPSVLFTTAGMQPLVPYLLGEPHPAGKRIVNIQKCVRTGDIDDVGDNRHLTFFEMMGNWSLGDYFKEDAIKWSYEFLTNRDEGLGLNPERLYVTIFEGDENTPLDVESKNRWISMGIPENRIYSLGAEDNWWSAGENGPCGPDTEMFYDMEGNLGDLSKEEFLQAVKNEKAIEIWNDVFMEFIKKDGKVVGKLSQRNVDTGAGLERITAVMQGKKTAYDTDLFKEMMAEIDSMFSHINYKTAKDIDYLLKSKRIIADHTRAAVFITGDGIKPYKNDRGYVLRKIIRRIAFHLWNFGLRDGDVLDNLIRITISKYGYIYSTLETNKELITSEIIKEISHFIKNVFKDSMEELLDYCNELSKYKPRAINNINQAHLISIDDFEQQKFKVEKAFYFVTSKGLPVELVKEIVVSFGFSLEDNFDEKFSNLIKKHQEVSKIGAEQRFKGGLADTSEISIKYHTATHLLHQALYDVLGSEVGQKGSNITPERLRFDFSFPRKMTEEEKSAVENLVNEKINEALPVQKTVMAKDEAEKTGARHFFGEKYPDEVSVYFVGENIESAYSKEFCGGPHVSNTSELGKFKIVKEEAVSAGVRRIKAILE